MSSTKNGLAANGATMESRVVLAPVDGCDDGGGCPPAMPAVSAGGHRHERKDRGTWNNQFEFFLSCLGYAVGLGNVWRFPYLCYANGGGAFLIPYTIMLLCAGLPLFGLELCLGQYASLGPNKVFKKMAPIFQGLGYGMLVITFFVAIYYNMIIAWTVFYLFASFTREVPWKYCGQDYNSVGCFSLDQDKACREEVNNTIFWNNTCTRVDIMCTNTLNTCLRIGDSPPSECEKTFYQAHNSTHCLNKTAREVGAEDIFLHVPLKIAYDHISPSEDYFSRYMLEVSDGWHDFGGLKWQLVLCLSFAWLIVGASLIKGVHSSGKVVYFTALFPYVVLIIFCIQGAMLPGAAEGIEFYVTPKWELLKHPKVWGEAATQIFYSLGPGFGGLITLSSYNKFSNNCIRDAIVVAFCNCLTSVFAGFVIFSIVGYMAHQVDVPVSQVIKSGPGLAFIAYPDAIAQLPASPLWSVLFFVMLITLGLDSQFTMVETLITALLDELPGLRRRKSVVVVLACVLGFVLGLSMCARGGVYMFTLIDSYSAGWSLLILAFLELVVVQYVYGYKRFLSNINEMIGKVMFPTKYYWLLNWCFVAPCLIMGILIFSWIEYQPASYGGTVFPEWVNAIGWTMAFSPIVIVLTMALHQIIQARRKNMCWRSLFEPTEDWGPALFREQRKIARHAQQLEMKKNNRSDTRPDSYDNPAYMEDLRSPYTMSTHL